MIIISYLSDYYKTQFGYATALNRMKDHTLVVLETKESLISFLKNYNYSDNQVVILAHGGKSGISKSQEIDESFVGWQELLNSFINIQIAHRLKLNLCAICNSNSILEHNIIQNINLILYSNSKVSSIHAALELSGNDFTTKINNFEDDDKGELLYGFYSNELLV